MSKNREPVSVDTMRDTGIGIRERVKHEITFRAKEQAREVAEELEAFEALSEDEQSTYKFAVRSDIEAENIIEAMGYSFDEDGSSFTNFFQVRGEAARESLLAKSGSYSYSPEGMFIANTGMDQQSKLLYVQHAYSTIPAEAAV